MLQAEKEKCAKCRTRFEFERNLFLQVQAFERFNSSLSKF